MQNKKTPFVTKQQVEEIVKTYPTPFHIYDEKSIRENARGLKAAFSWNKGFKEYFAVKATPNPFLLQLLREEGVGVDCSSLTELMLSDTVGFIAKLPHHLVDAFRATLEELEYADLLLHVIDAADPDREAHISVVNGLISKLAKPGTKVLECYNKADLVSPQDIPVGEGVVRISAKQGFGMDDLLKAIEETLGHSRHHIFVTLPYSMGGLLDTLHSGAQVLSEDYTQDGIVVETIVDPILYGRLKDYITKEC